MNPPLSAYLQTACNLIFQANSKWLDVPVFRAQEISAVGQKHLLDGRFQND